MFGLDEIGLYTSTRWSPRTWQLLLIFHLDRVNRLPKQTQRRVYGCAAPAQQRGGGGGGVKIFHWGVSPSNLGFNCRDQASVVFDTIDKASINNRYHWSIINNYR